MATITTDSVSERRKGRARIPSGHAEGVPRGVPPGPALLIVVCAFLLGYAASFAWMLPVWLDYRSHYGHGLLVIGLVGYLLWQERAQLPGTALRPRAFMFAVLAILCASAAWFAGATAGVRVPTVLTGIPIAWLAMSVVLGRGALWRLTPYFALILSVVPVWQVLSPVLQALATRVVNGVLHGLGLTIFMEGNTIVMPQITFEIVGGCSGLGFLLVAFTLAVYLAVSHRLKFAHACLLVLGFAAMAVFANWLRITLIMLVGYYYGPGNSLVQDHLWFGWAIFAVILVAGIVFLLPRLPVPEETTRGKLPPVRGLSAPSLLLLVAAIGTLPALKVALDTLARMEASAPVWASPAEDSAYRGVARPTTWLPQYPKAEPTRKRTYDVTGTENQRSLTLFQAFYRHQTDRAEVIDADNDLAGAGWKALHERRLETLLYGQTRPIGELLLANESGVRRLVWFWYRIGNAHVASDRRAKIEQVLQKLRLRADAMLTAVSAPCVNDDACDTARQQLRVFTGSLQVDESSG